jgi:hypothetical protein
MKHDGISIVDMGVSLASALVAAAAQLQLFWQLRVQVEVLITPSSS